MSRILLLTGQAANRRLLAATLGDRHEVTAPETDQEVSVRFSEEWDLVLVDGPSFQGHRNSLTERVAAEGERFLPVGLIVPREKIDHLPPDVWEAVDDVLTTPLSRRELTARTESLLRIRDLSKTMEAKALEQLRASEQRFRTVTELVSDFAFALVPGDDGWELAWATHAIESLLGRPAKELGGLWPEVIDPRDEAALGAHMARLEAGEADTAEFRVRDADDGVHWIRVYARPEGLGPDRLVGGVQDITERRQAEQEREQASRALEILSRCERALAHAKDESQLFKDIGHIIHDLGGYSPTVILLWSEQKGDWEWFGPTAPANWQHLPTADELTELGGQVMAQDHHGIIDLGPPPTLREQDGGGDILAVPLVWEREGPMGVLFLGTSQQPVERELDLLGELGRDLAVGRSTLQLREREQEQEAYLEYLAYHDAALDIPNQTALEETLDEVVNNGTNQLAVAVLDLGGYQEIRDTLGLKTAQKVARRADDRIREVARNETSPALLAAGQFGLMCPELPSMAVQENTERILDRLTQPIEANGLAVRLQPLAGLACYPSDGQSGAELVRAAASALPSQAGDTERIRFFSAERRAHIQKQLTLAADLHHALDQGDLSLYAHPKVAIASGRVSGYEGLARWFKPDGATISPGEFVPVAEGTGLVEPLTDWVLETGLRQQQAWMAQGIHLPLALNVSARNLQNAQFPDQVRALLERWSVPPELLELEVTEEALIADPQSVLATMHELRELGVALAIDDFGTGYSSMSYLKDLPVTTLKIDRSFIQDIENDSRAHAIVRTAIGLAHDLGMAVVAEGVENDGIMALLGDLGCEHAQGFGITKPMATGAIAEWLTERGELN